MRILLLLLVGCFLVNCSNSNIEDNIVEPVQSPLEFNVEKVDQTTALIQLFNPPTQNEEIVIFHRLNGERKWLETLDAESQVYEHNHNYDFFVDYRGTCLRVPYQSNNE